MRPAEQAVVDAVRDCDHSSDGLCGDCAVMLLLIHERSERAVLEAIRDLADANHAPWHADTVPVFQEIWTLAVQALRRDPAGDNVAVFDTSKRFSTPAGDSGQEGG